MFELVQEKKAYAIVWAQPHPVKPGVVRMKTLVTDDREEASMVLERLRRKGWPYEACYFGA